MVTPWHLHSNLGVCLNVVAQLTSVPTFSPTWSDAPQTHRHACTCMYKYTVRALSTPAACLAQGILRGDSSLLAVLLVIRLLPTFASCALAPQACAVLLRQWRAAFAFRMDRCTSDVDDLLDSFCGLPTPGTPGSSDPPSKVAKLGPEIGSSQLSSYADSN